MLLTLPAVALAQPYNEAPALAEQVAAGTLPPVVERLPAAPEVVTPLGEVGSYGGVLRSGMVGASDQSFLLRWIGGQGLVRYDTNMADVIPNVADSYEVSDDYTVYTFNLRQGLKWSDGQPFTIDDVAFSVEDVLFNPDLLDTPSQFRINGLVPTFAVVDDDTFTFTFPQPNANFLVELTRWEGQGPVYFSKAYCGQFHPAVTPALADVPPAGFTDWQAQFSEKCGDVRSAARFINVERPTLDPWLITQPYDGGATQVTFERNPYFWQVDTAGNQLPYVDKLEIAVYQDVQALLLAAIGGRIDWQFRKLDTPVNRPVLADGIASGEYDLAEMTSLGGSKMVIIFNLTHKDEGLRDLFNEKDFRVALSLGMDRSALIETVLSGESEPFQGGPFATSPLYHERFSTQYLDFDQAEANALLDGIGLTERNAEGLRLLPDGRPVRFSIDVNATDQPEFLDMLILIEQNWAELGVDLQINAIEGSLLSVRQEGNDADALAASSQEAWIPGQPPFMLVPVDAPKQTPWAKWYATGGAEGEEPPAGVKERLELWTQVKQTLDPDERKRLFHAMADSAADEFPMIGTVKATSTYGIGKTALGNVPPTMPHSSMFPSPTLWLPQVWYWKQ